MLLPRLDDTIVAVSTPWEPTPVSVLRLSGPDSFSLVASLCESHRPAERVCWTREAIRVAHGHRIPARVFWFPSPRSYTGQAVVEIHVPGCLPLVRELAGALARGGARGALPGEFTARAFLAGKLDAAQVDAVFDLIHAADRSGVAEARRLSRGSRQHGIERWRAELLDLLALVEAEIDFSDEDDVSFVSARQLAATIDRLLEEWTAGCESGVTSAQRRLPHVVLVGLANAGKSTLFNALAGQQRAIVSPVVGTTRDVLSAEITASGVRFVLQDCAGIGEATHPIDIAAQLATHETLAAADLVLWVHPLGVAWGENERQTLMRLASDQLVLVRSKCDVSSRASDEHVPARRQLDVSAHTGEGLAGLKEAISDAIAATRGSEVGDEGLRLDDAIACLQRARELIGAAPAGVFSAELVAAELREAESALSSGAQRDSAEAVLARIFSGFCIGK